MTEKETPEEEKELKDFLDNWAKTQELEVCIDLSDDSWENRPAEDWKEYVEYNEGDEWKKEDIEDFAEYALETIKKVREESKKEIVAEFMEKMHIYWANWTKRAKNENNMLIEKMSIDWNKRFLGDGK